MRSRLIFLLTFLLMSLAAHADATLLVEEPINFIGRFTVSGHVALLLDNLCSPDHLHIQPCAGGQPGIVISRYNDIGHHDWLAMDPAPYLYAADDDNHLPAFISSTQVAALREQYRVEHLEALAPNPAHEHWIQLAGAAYRRRIYCITLRTTPAQDLRLTQWLNRRSNRSHFNLLFNNCADFVRQALNVLYPARSTAASSSISASPLPSRSPPSSTATPAAIPSSASAWRLSPRPRRPAPQRSQPRRLRGLRQDQALLLPHPYVVPITTGAVIAAGLADHRFDLHSAARNAPELDLDPPTTLVRPADDLK